MSVNISLTLKDHSVFILNDKLAFTLGNNRNLRLQCTTLSFSDASPLLMTFESLAQFGPLKFSQVQISDLVLRVNYKVIIQAPLVLNAVPLSSSL